MYLLLYALCGVLFVLLDYQAITHSATEAYKEGQKEGELEPDSSLDALQSALLVVVGVLWPLGVVLVFRRWLRKPSSPSHD